MYVELQKTLIHKCTNLNTHTRTHTHKQAMHECKKKYNFYNYYLLFFKARETIFVYADLVSFFVLSNEINPKARTLVNFKYIHWTISKKKFLSHKHECEVRFRRLDLS